MPGHTAIELRAYLKKRKHKREQDDIPVFDTFLNEVGVLFKLRLASEENFKRNPHLAKNKRHALPLSWTAIKEVLNPDKKTPPETTLTRIVRECTNEVESIVQDMRKVLIREREKVSLGMVQQVDAHCLRWLTRQPGRDAVEKAGARQKILAVVRRENYNTLENRVFKEFLERAGEATRRYLKDNEKKFAGHELIGQVKRLSKLCKEGLTAAAMDTIADLRELPMPNYVLRQERRYAKIWKAFCDLVREADIAERLWHRREELTGLLQKLTAEVPVQTSPRAKFHSPLWFNHPDGKQEFLDKPFYQNETAPSEIDGQIPMNDGDFILDINNPICDLLIYGKHLNAKPYLQNYRKPSIEDMDGSGHYFLDGILAGRDAQKLKDYFEQLHGIAGGRRWLVLIPDDYDVLLQELILKSVPLPRQNVVLLWRSVAAAIAFSQGRGDIRENSSICIADKTGQGKALLSRLTYITEQETGELIPQRRAFVHHKECYQSVSFNLPQEVVPFEARFLYGKRERAIFDYRKENDIEEVYERGTYNEETDPELLEKGALVFLQKRDRNETAYYDELEALSLIRQTRDERIEARELVKHQEKFPGGRSIEEKIGDAAIIRRTQETALFLLCMGDPAGDAPLKELTYVFEDAPDEDQPLELTARMTPGQGMAAVTVKAPFLRHPIELNFLEMKDTRKTISFLEENMERSFPPDPPNVVADYWLWDSIENEVLRYMNGGAMRGNLFARAANVYSSLEEVKLKGLSPIEILRRKNVFGNDAAHRLPKDMHGRTVNFDFDSLFKKLAVDEAEHRHRHRHRWWKSIQLIAWTYQGDNSLFNETKQVIISRLHKLAAEGEAGIEMRPQEYSLLANLCVTPAEWKSCLDAVLSLLSSGSISEDGLRLLYNILQFHPTIIRDTGFHNNDRCWDLMRHLPCYYNRHTQNSAEIGYILKSMLYLLRCRRFDGKKFLTREHDEEHYNTVAQCLSQQVWHTKETLRKLVLKYLNGKGTIGDLPTD